MPHLITEPWSDVIFDFKNSSWVADEACKEELRRLLISDLVEFAKYFFDARGDKFLVNHHHRKIADALADVREGRVRNLLINLPPRYSKSEMAVICFIAQSLAANPAAKFIHLSYSDDLALENSSKARDLILSDQFQELWPLVLREDANSKKKWYTMAGGGLYATSSGGPITGFGAGATREDDDSDGFFGAIILDDPLKVDDAENKGERDFINERLNTTIKSRRNSRKTPIIIIMQRLHEDDMSGYVLTGGMGEKFDHLKMPAIQDDGTALWPMKHTLEELMQQKAANPFVFSGQMQQEPSPEDGTFFRKEWFRRYKPGTQPELTIYGAADYAVTEGGGDFTEIGIGGFEKEEVLLFVDWWSGQATPDLWISEQIRLVKDNDPVVFVAEGGTIRRAVEPFLKKEQRAKACYFRQEWINSNKNRAANARAIQALASQGKLHIPENAWGDALIFQLLQFPAGKYDDKVDVLGLFGRILDQTFGPRKAPAVRTNEKDPWVWEETQLNEWKLN